MSTAEMRKKDIVDALYWDTKVNASDIKVTVDNSTATLTGTVPSYVASWAAEEDAWHVPGIYSVNNQLTVDYPAPPTDGEIMSNVENVLLWNSAVDSSKIDVLAVNGHVTLKGTVDTYWQSWRAEELARDINGVIEVTNELSVVPTEDFLDEDIASDIVSAFERTMEVDEDKVTVKVENGVVTLTGKLPTWYARRKAYRIARDTPGVISVTNLITRES